MTRAMYDRTNKTTGAVMTGNWDEVCDFDKRIWTDPKLVMDHDERLLMLMANENKLDTATPILAMVWAVRTRNHQVHIERVPIFTLHDLRELRI